MNMKARASNFPSSGEGRMGPEKESPRLWKQGQGVRYRKDCALCRPSEEFVLSQKSCCGNPRGMETF